MSKKSGFFYAMFALFGAMFASHSYASEKNAIFQPTAPTGGGGGNGQQIRSHGKKRVWPSVPRDIEKHQKHRNMVEAYARVGITWVNNKLYWSTRKLAEENVGVRTDLIISN